MNNTDKVMRYSNFLSIVALIVLLSSCGRGEKAQYQQPPVAHNVFSVHPEPNGIESAATLPATVEEGRIISVGFKTGGQIERIYVKEGDHIKAGQTIACLDSEDKTDSVIVV
ncbi:MAG: biotin/lipoyl-binding protein [Duncaniella sp.]|nr:biotin/lipoyl-binding protein [Duncaniella sp.]